MVKKIAVFQTVLTDPCTSANINDQTFGTPLSYDVLFTLPNPKVVLTFSLNTDSQSVATGKPLKCGKKTYSTD